MEETENFHYYGAEHTKVMMKTVKGDSDPNRGAAAVYRIQDPYIAHLIIAANEALRQP
jgi:hypothetical protein